MARKSTPVPVEPAGDAEQALAPVEQVEQQLGEFDVEAWVAAVYAHQNNGGPAPVRTYRVAPAEPVHVDATGAVTAVEREA